MLIEHWNHWTHWDHWRRSSLRQVPLCWRSFHEVSSSWLWWTTIEEQVNQDCLGQEGHFGFCPTCRTQKRWMVLLPLSSVKEEVWWCFAGDTLGDKVTKLGSYLTNMAATALCSRSPSHSWTSTKFSSRLWKHYWTSEEWYVSDVLASTSSDLNPNEMVWDELDHKEKAKKPVRQFWEFHFFRSWFFRGLSFSIDRFDWNRS